jgi:hypothetical protein
MSERNLRYSKRRRGQEVDKGEKHAIQRAAPEARCRQAKETSNATSDVAGKPSTSGGNQGCSERRGGQVVDGGIKQTEKRAARQSRRKRVKETIGIVRGKAGKTSMSEETSGIVNSESSKVSTRE